MTEHLAHVLGADGVTPVRFEVEEHPGGRRTATNTDPITMGVNDVLDIPVAGGAIRLIGTGATVVRLDLYAGPEGDLRSPWTLDPLDLGDPDDDG